MKVSVELSNSFRISNLIATILVVAIHYNSIHHIETTNGITINYYIQEFVTQGIARIAVPFFSFASGFFFFISFNSLSDYIPHISKRTRTILVPYIIACTLIFLVNIFYLKFFKNISYDYTLHGLLSDIIFKPISIQFWFLRDLIILSLISPIMYYIYKTPYGFIYLLLLFITWFMNIQPLPKLFDRHLVNIETLFFFSLGGYFIYKVNNIEHFFHPSHKISMFFSVLIVTLFLFRILIYPQLDQHSIMSPDNYGLLIQKASIVLGVYTLIVISFYIKSNNLIYFSSFTFFIYLYHVLPVRMLTTYISHRLIEAPLLFYINFPLALTIVIICAYILHKHLTPLYNILTGNRGP